VRTADAKTEDVRGSQQEAKSEMSTCPAGTATSESASARAGEESHRLRTKIVRGAAKDLAQLVTPASLSRERTRHAGR
jgi:hypothetical protein